MTQQYEDQESPAIRKGQPMSHASHDPRHGAAPSRARMDEAMAVGAARYADIIATLNGAGLPTVFTQTGGMCAALEVTLENGQHLLITDAEDSLSWERAEQRGWGVGRYVTDSEYDDGPLAFADSEDTDSNTLLRLVGEVLVPQGE